MKNSIILKKIEKVCRTYRNDSAFKNIEESFIKDLEEQIRIFKIFNKV